MKIDLIVLGFVLVILCGMASIVINEMFAIGTIIGSIYVMWGLSIMTRTTCT